MGDLDGKTALITGANSGIGFETASALASRGCSVVLACRRRDAAEAAATAIRVRHPSAQITVMELDLASQASVKSCADAFVKSGRPLHVLINNAGANFYNAKPWYTPEGIGGSAQVNFLGAFTLTRLLSKPLAASAPSRVVTLSSVMHRAGTLQGGPNRFLKDFESGTYSHAKLAEVLFSYELDRRASARGVRAVAVDPGAVQTNIWVGTPLAQRGIKSLMDRLYSPPREGAAAVVHAATADLDACAPPRGSPEPGRLFFARGLFAAAPVTADHVLPRPLWQVGTLLMSLCDQPLRTLSGGRLGAVTAAVRSSPETYDKVRAGELWRAAAEAAGQPAQAGKDFL